ncbi:hypothetical protein SALBM311S_09613 [Streptomyces alboniger]
MRRRTLSVARREADHHGTRTPRPRRRPRSGPPARPRSRRHRHRLERTRSDAGVAGGALRPPLRAGSGMARAQADRARAHRGRGQRTRVVSCLLRTPSPAPGSSPTAPSRCWNEPASGPPGSASPTASAPSPVNCPAYWTSWSTRQTCCGPAAVCTTSATSRPRSPPSPRGSRPAAPLLRCWRTGLPARLLPRDIGIGRPGLQARLDSLEEEWFGADARGPARRRRRDRGLAGVVAAAELRHTGTRSFLLDLPAPPPIGPAPTRPPSSPACATASAITSTPPTAPPSTDCSTPRTRRACTGGGTSSCLPRTRCTRRSVRADAHRRHLAPQSVTPRPPPPLTSRALQLMDCRHPLSTSRAHRGTHGRHTRHSGRAHHRRRQRHRRRGRPATARRRPPSGRHRPRRGTAARLRRGTRRPGRPVDVRRQRGRLRRRTLGGRPYAQGVRPAGHGGSQRRARHPRLGRRG